jgi:hypothetical protein
MPHSGTDRDGYHWVWGSYEELAKKWFLLWQPATLKKHILKLERMGYLISEQLDKKEWSRIKYYRLNYAKLNEEKAEDDNEPATDNTDKNPAENNVSDSVPPMRPNLGPSVVSKMSPSAVNELSRSYNEFTERYNRENKGVSNIQYESAPKPPPPSPSPKQAQNDFYPRGFGFQAMLEQQQEEQPRHIAGLGGKVIPIRTRTELTNAVLKATGLLAQANAGDDAALSWAQKAVGVLYEMGYTTTKSIQKLKTHWDANDWRGQRGDYPSPQQLTTYASRMSELNSQQDPEVFYVIDPATGDVVRVE